MTKSKIFIFLSLFLISFIFSHTSPLPHNTGDVATVKLTKPDVKFKFTQTDDQFIKAEGVINQGIEDYDPTKYFVHVSNEIKLSFANLKIITRPPGIVPWTNTLLSIV
ncbi:hypothetical protein Glove_365g156 [Diversispora epigaea]|uniref:Uncharacterized protein n=1 Tax=Diversispora epigaea TaxID=1348612 RepID=A0A397H7V5_9GLOM|nr:hypothetical protein Glove_365g156 [Diversispora epigaea]